MKSGKDNPAHQFSHLAQPTLQNGHTQKLIRPEREAQRGPFASQYQDGKEGCVKSEIFGTLFFLYAAFFIILEPFARVA